MAQKKTPPKKRTSAKKPKAPAKKKAAPKKTEAEKIEAKIENTVVEIQTIATLPQTQRNYFAGFFCLFGILLHILIGADSCDCVGGFFDFSLTYFIIFLPVQAAGIFWLYMSGGTKRWLGFTILVFALWDLYLNARFAMNLFYSDLTMCEFTNNIPSYCSVAFEVSLAHIITSSAMALGLIAVLVKHKLFSEKAKA